MKSAELNGDAKLPKWSREERLSNPSLESHGCLSKTVRLGLIFSLNWPRFFFHVPWWIKADEGESERDGGLAAMTAASQRLICFRSVCVKCQTLGFFWGGGGFSHGGESRDSGFVGVFLPLPPLLFSSCLSSVIFFSSLLSLPLRVLPLFFASVCLSTKKKKI